MGETLRVGKDVPTPVAKEDPSRGGAKVVGHDASQHQWSVVDPGRAGYSVLEPQKALLQQALQILVPLDCCPTGVLRGHCGTVQRSDVGAVTSYDHIGPCLL